MISIVTAYYNRKDLFYQTLKSIKKSKFTDIEVIAVDDGSSSEQRLEDLYDEFSFLKIIRLDENKWYKNPCIPFNIGIKEARGNIIVLQNPECLHVHDVLTYISDRVDDSNYISISAYGINEPMNKIIIEENKKGTLRHYFYSLPQQAYTGYDSIGWYNHSRYRPVHYHFCSAITRTNMAKLNGFDERYAKGIGFDDDELIMRIRKLGLRMIIEDNVSVIHQYHDTAFWNLPEVKELTEVNRQLLNNVTYRENKYKANYKNLWNGN